jgi:superfamily II DNA or RNA helicase
MVPALSLADLAPADRSVLVALALGTAPRTRSWVHGVLGDPALRPPGASAPSQDQVKLAFRALHAAGLLVEARGRMGFWSVAPAVEAEAYGALLACAPAERLRTVLASADGYLQSLRPGFAEAGYLGSAEAGFARLRLDAFSGVPPAALRRVADRMPYQFLVDDVDALLERVIAPIAEDALFDRLHPDVQRWMLSKALEHAGTSLQRGLALPMARIVERAREACGQSASEGSAPLDLLRWCLALHEVAAAAPEDRDDAWAARVMAGVDPNSSTFGPQPGWRRALEGAIHARRGQWEAAESAFDEALAMQRKGTGRRKGLLPPLLAPLHVTSLMALGGAVRLEKALKFALAESGVREPRLDTPLGYLALAIKMRLGETPRQSGPFEARRHTDWQGRPLAGPSSRLDLWRWLARAWLKDGAQAEPISAVEAGAAAHLRESLEAVGRHGETADLAAALQVIGGETAPPWFFVASGVEGWQSALLALAAIGDPAREPSARAARTEPATRLVWTLDIGAGGALRDIEALEQKQGPRGWGKPKPVALSRLQRAGVTVVPRDAAVIASVRQESYGRTFRLDLAAAAAALVGHPHVVFAEAPEQFIELVEGAATLDVVEEGDRLRVRIDPPLRVVSDDAVARWDTSAEHQREMDALRLVSVWRDGPRRARLVRLSPAQKRVAQLLGTEGLEIPRRGAAQLQQVLAGLGSHFEIHADEVVAAQATREVEAEPRLRAELQPVGPGLQVRLLAAPYGEAHAADGPRLVPGRGRARLLMKLGDETETLGVQRDLARERQNLLDLLDVCPMLMELAADAPCEWQVESPDDALALVERLHQHHAVAALDWPQGRPIRVQSAAIGQLSVKVRTHEHWLAVNGELKVDEELVVSLQQLLAFGATGRSRFVPLGEGRYVALTQELRERIDDLAAVAEAHAGKAGTLAELRVPKAAAPWLQAAVLGARTEHDAAFARQLEALDAARQVVPALPSTLQATLRPYQEEGFEWAMRLAHAGLGGCLADDMGLGKTLQSLAVLLARAGGGPALVVAPTSLLGNWRAEAARFAPSLRVTIYAEGGGADVRREQVATQGRHDVLLVSYPMLQIDAEAFTAREGGWHTLILDEAQAIKNAGAKRSQAVFALRADFRLALSGTPIENRLGELWSIMRACNPGLLGTQARFNDRFANLIERQHDRHAQRLLRRLIAPFLLRRTKAEVLADLPPRTELVLKVPPGEAERAHYEALRREALIAAEKSLSGDGAGQAHLNILAGLTRLRRAACDPRLTSPKLKLTGAKVAAFAELAQELVANGHKALVFSQFVDFLALLREPLDAAGIAYQTLDGSTPAAERTRRVDAFQSGEGDLFLISLKAGGFGLNLTVADYVVIADPWWNPAAEDQASGRAHRIGQQRPVTVYRLVAQGTLEERIVEMHAAKRELAEGVLEGTEGKALPTADELLALMRNDAAGAATFE